MRSNRCTRGGNEHRFEPRYDERMPEGLSVDRITADALKTMKTYTYVRDVCVRCGKTIERGAEERQHAEPQFTLPSATDLSPPRKRETAA